MQLLRQLIVTTCAEERLSDPVEYALLFPIKLKSLSCMERCTAWINHPRSMLRSWRRYSSEKRRDIQLNMLVLTVLMAPFEKYAMLVDVTQQPDFVVRPSFLLGRKTMSTLQAQRQSPRLLPTSRNASAHLVQTLSTL